MTRTVRKTFYLMLCCFLLLTLLSVPICADMGPKPSVRITFENMGDQLCYGTLLLVTPSTGPYSAWDGNEERMDFDRLDNVGISKDLWRAFTYYEDPDGYHFLQEAIWQVNESKQLAWTYYPPDSFKILLYYPETDQYAVSGICQKYAFDTYYTVDMAGTDMGSVDYNEELSGNSRLNAYKSYQWRQEMLSLVARIFITIAIEMGVALLFGFRGKKILLLLAVANVLTQIPLNLLLNLINFRSGSWAFIAGYIGLEFAVFAMEALYYSVALKKLASKDKPTYFYVIYAFVANAISFVTGIFVANLLPGIF